MDKRRRLRLKLHEGVVSVEVDFEQYLMAVGDGGHGLMLRTELRGGGDCMTCTRRFTRFG